MNLFLDDLKEPKWYGIDSTSLVVVRSGEEALKITCNTARLLHPRTEKLITLYLDHDLGKDMSGYTFLDTILKEGIIPKEVVIISLNPVGIQRLIALCNDYQIPYRVGGFPNVPVIGSNVSKV